MYFLMLLHTNYEVLVQDKNVIFSHSHLLIAESRALISESAYFEQPTLNDNILSSPNIYQYQPFGNFNIGIHDNQLSSLIAMAQQKYFKATQAVQNLNITEATRDFEQAADGYSKAEDIRLSQEMFLRVCTLAFVNGKYQKALSIFQNLQQQQTRLSTINFKLWKTNLLIATGSNNAAESLIMEQILPLRKSKVQEQQCYYLLGKLYLKSSKFTQAKWFFIQSFELARKNHHTTAQINSLVYLAKTKNKIKDFSLAINDLKVAAAMASNLSSYIQMDVYHTMAQTYAYLHRTKESRYYQQKFNHLKNQYLQSN